MLDSKLDETLSLCADLLTRIGSGLWLHLTSTIRFSDLAMQDIAEFVVSEVDVALELHCRNKYT